MRCDEQRRDSQHVDRVYGEDGRNEDDSPSEHDRRDLVERDERRLLRDEQELALKEVQLAFVRLEVALDSGLAVVTVRSENAEVRILWALSAGTCISTVIARACVHARTSHGSGQ